MSQNRVPIKAPTIQIKKGFSIFFTLVNKLGKTNAINRAIVLIECTAKGAPLKNIRAKDNTKKTIAMRITLFNFYTL